MTLSPCESFHVNSTTTRRYVGRYLFDYYMCIKPTDHNAFWTTSIWICSYFIRVLSATADRMSPLAGPGHVLSPYLILPRQRLEDTQEMHSRTRMYSYVFAPKLEEQMSVPLLGLNLPFIACLKCQNHTILIYSDECTALRNRFPWPPLGLSNASLAFCVFTSTVNFDIGLRILRLSDVFRPRRRSATRWRQSWNHLRCRGYLIHDNYCLQSCSISAKFESMYSFCAWLGRWYANAPFFRL